MPSTLASQEGNHQTDFERRKPRKAVKCLGQPKDHAVIPGQYAEPQPGAKPGRAVAQNAPGAYAARLLALVFRAELLCDPGSFACIEPARRLG
jgi:hypothetical protein